MSKNMPGQLGGKNNNSYDKCELSNEPINNTDYRKRETPARYCCPCDEREEMISWNIKHERARQPRCE